MYIQSAEDYNLDLELVEHLMLTIDDSGCDPLSDWIDIIAKGIEEYEVKRPEIQNFIKGLDDMPKDISTLLLLMQQYQLGVNDFNHEIGSKSYVSMILNQERQLNKKHISKLCKRFNLSTELFF